MMMCLIKVALGPPTKKVLVKSGTFFFLYFCPLDVNSLQERQKHMSQQIGYKPYTTMPANADIPINPMGVIPFFIILFDPK